MVVDRSSFDSGKKLALSLRCLITVSEPHQSNRDDCRMKQCEAYVLIASANDPGS